MLLCMRFESHHTMFLARKAAERKKEENETRRQKARNFREAQENS